MVLNPVLDRFADSTSLHGVPRVIQAKSVMGRMFWSLIFVVSVSIFCFQIVEVLTHYYSFPKKVTMEVVSTHVSFPSISICNMRNLDVHVLNTLNRMFIEDNNPYNHINKSDNPFINEYMKALAKYAPLWMQYQDTHPKLFQEVFSRTTFSANIPTEIISLAAVQLEGLVVKCQYAGRVCNTTRDFSLFFDPYYFNCFTYEAPSLHNFDSLTEGVENGWSTIVLSGSGMLDKNKYIRMLPGLHESKSAISASEGIRVVIHPRNTQPYPFTEGYDVPPGFSASFGIRPRRNIRIGLPHGNCSSKNSFGDGESRYRLMACQKRCLQQHIVKTCNCSDVNLPQLNNSDAPFCRNDDEFPDHCAFNATENCLAILSKMYTKIQCAKTARAKASKSTTVMEACKCFPPCDEISYDVSYSLSKWPANGYEGDAAYLDVFTVEDFKSRFNKPSTSGKFVLFENYFTANRREESMKEFARLNVYVVDSNVVKTAELPSYTRNQLFSDIGGQFGLWLGISVISLAEVIAFLCDIFRYFSKV